MQNQNSDKKIRLQKYIADCGVTSRRKAEALIIEGRVTINGVVNNVLGTKVDPQNDAVEVDGSVLDLNSVQKIYMVLHKPRGIMTTVSDPEGRRTVLDLVKDVSERVYPVGRLDYLSEGLLLLTNDGDFAHTIMHPKHKVIKVYEVKVFGAVNPTILKKLRAGVFLEEGFVKPLSVRIINQLPTKTWLEVRLSDGKNREIRRICEMVGLTVDKLKRVAIGNLSIDGLAPGKFELHSKQRLLAAIGFSKDGTLLEEPKEFISSKKSVKLSKKGTQKATLASDDTFKKFRKDTYFDVLKTLKTKKFEAAKKPKRPPKVVVEEPCDQMP